MKTIKILLIFLWGIISLSSCSDFFDVVPHDALTPATFWKSESDAEQGLTACYYNWVDQNRGSSLCFYEDVESDIGYNYTHTGNFSYIAEGTSNASNAVNYYKYDAIHSVNVFLAHIDDVPFTDEAKKKDYIAQARVIRAYNYYRLCWLYGGVPLITEPLETAEEAQLPRNSEEEVKKFVINELEAATPDLQKKASARGRIDQGTAMAIEMRAQLYWGNYKEARNLARKIVALNQYSLDPNFLQMFTVAGQDSPEIIYAYQHVKTTYPYSDMIRFPNNADGGWASWVPTQNLVDMFEMNNGLMPNDPDSGYDPVHPYANRDPRLKNTVVYPGEDWVQQDGTTRIINTVDKFINGKTNTDYYLAADNASKTGLIFAKYTTPLTQYSTSYSNDNTCPIYFRYAEVLLTIAECDVELNENLSEALDLIDQLRQRGGQVKVDRSRYQSQQQMRTLVRRERTIELAGEGFRRADIVRWKNGKGQLVANDVMTDLYRAIGTINYNETDPDKRFVQILPTDANKADRFVQSRSFKDYQRYMPIPQTELDRNPNLTQTDGYDK